tara:strand:+ start:294 stop:509 length:216 start_codon:yes stop_codon:yes gene_type:complete
MTTEEAEFSGQAIMKQLEERRAAQRKSLNKNVLGVRTSNNLAAQVREHCKSNNLSTNQFLNNLLKEFFNHA